MLTELYQYALDHALAARPGFKPKSVKCYVQLTSDGRFVDIVPAEKDKTMAPDIGGLAQGSSYCNILIEKALYPLCILTGDGKKDKNTPIKHDFYLNAVREGGGHSAALRAIAAALSNDATRECIARKMCGKYKPADPIGFEVNGLHAEESTDWLEWWESYRQTLGRGKREDSADPVCLITGQNAPALETVPKVSGLMFVGGHSAGDAFLCFDKDAFTSYGLKKSANAPVSEAAMTGVNAALTELIRRASVFGGAKMVYWYSQDIPPAQDPMQQLLGQDALAEDDGLDLFGTDAPVDTPATDAELTRLRREADAEAAVRRMLRSVEEGKRPHVPDARYFIMPISGMSGRMMVRGWYEGQFADLCQHVAQWYDDLQLTLPGNRGDANPPKLKRLGIVLLKPGGDPKKVFDRMDKELAALLSRMFGAAVNGAPLPDAVAAKALYTLRSCLLDAGKDGDDRQRRTLPPLTVYQILKCWLVRRQRERGEIIMSKQLKQDYPSPAYQCGRLMAVYAAIQQEALGKDIGAGVVERYYGAAIVSPRFVLGSLSRLSNYHLAKIDNPDYAQRFRRMLNEISTHIIPGTVPQIMSMEQQTEFALGYYQQNAAIYTKAANLSDEAEENG